MAKLKPLHSIKYAAAMPAILVLAGIIMLAVLPTTWAHTGGVTSVHNTCGTTPLAVQIHAVAYVNRALLTALESVCAGLVISFLLCSCVLLPARFTHWCKRHMAQRASSKMANAAQNTEYEEEKSRKRKLADRKRRIIAYLDRCSADRAKNQMHVAVSKESSASASWGRRLRMLAWLVDNSLPAILTSLALGMTFGCALCDTSCVDASHKVAIKATSMLYTGAVLAVLTGILLAGARRAYMAGATSIAKYNSAVTTWAQLALWCRATKQDWGPLRWATFLQRDQSINLPQCAHIDTGELYQHIVTATLSNGAVRILYYIPNSSPRSGDSFELLIEPWGTTVRMRVEVTYGNCTLVNLKAHENDRFVLAHATGPQDIKACGPILKWLVQQATDKALKNKCPEELEVL